MSPHLVASRVLRRAGLTGSALGLALACSGLASAGPSARNGRIAFLAFGHAYVNIFTVNPNGTGVRKLSKKADSFGGPTWSPDGKRIAVRYGDGISIMSADGSALVYVIAAEGGRARRVSGGGRLTARRSPTTRMASSTSSARTERGSSG